jgi:hypothetical protein
MVLPRVPAFYRQLTSDPERYGVLDLPHGWLGESSRASAYHSYQLVHRKPIAWASLSREYTRYPNDGLDAIWTGDPAGALAARARLRELGYRYVVWHKHAAELFAVGRVSEGAAERPRGPAVPAFSDTFVRTAFHHDRPVVDDDLVTVFRVGP